jgi:hypothetical protein
VRYARSLPIGVDGPEVAPYRIGHRSDVSGHKGGEQALQPYAMLSTVLDAPAHDRVRQSYDAVAQEYAMRLGDDLACKPLDRALLEALIEQAIPNAPIADLGCGPVPSRLGSRAQGDLLPSRKRALSSVRRCALLDHPYRAL